jgi:hypothetical protein
LRQFFRDGYFNASGCHRALHVKRGLSKPILKAPDLKGKAHIVTIESAPYETLKSLDDQNDRKDDGRAAAAINAALEGGRR